MTPNASRYTWTGGQRRRETGLVPWQLAQQQQLDEEREREEERKGDVGEGAGDVEV